ncbi:MAG: hypothetical protein KKB21_02295 [Nanoarchaeota archaeon]|nr:hypothetical protein [Nanoarchaeota archaeon]MBU4086386.1 hypothetical protein [Nanoarchaeota archaeon]
MKEENQVKKNFVITKKIAKHGNQAIIVVPKVLENQLKPGTTCQISIEVLDNLNLGVEDEY